jgi:hypothetical protein
MVPCAIIVYVASFIVGYFADFGDFTDFGDFGDFGDCSILYYTNIINL